MFRFMTHNCKRDGFHRWGNPHWLDDTKTKFIRHCKTCLNTFIGEVKLIDDKVKLVKVEHTVNQCGSVNQNNE